MACLGLGVVLPFLSFHLFVCLSIFLAVSPSVNQNTNTNKNQLNIKNAFKNLKEGLNSDSFSYFENLFMQSTSLQYNNLKEQISGQVIKFFVYDT